MNRRMFLMSAAVGSTGFLQAQGQVSIGSFGADPSGRSDSTAALKNAVAAFKAGSGRSFVLPKGIYRLSGQFDLGNLQNVEVDGAGSTLLMTKGRGISIAGSSNLDVHDLTIDYDPLPFTQGVVADSGLNWLTLKVDPGYPVPAQTELTALGSYDRSIKNYAQTPLEIYGKDVSSVQATGPSQLRVQFKRPVSVPTGTVLVLRFKMSSEGVSMRSSRRVTVRNFRLRTAYSLGFSIAACSDLKFSGVEIAVPPGSDRLMSSLADGMHITNCSGSLTIENSVFQSMGDDAININAATIRFGDVPSASATPLVRRSGALVLASDDVQVAKAGDRLEVLDPHDLHIVAHARASADIDNSIKASVEEGASIPDGALVVDPNLVPTVRITGCQFKGNRARAILVHKSATITNNTFHNLTSSAILMVPDPNEGPSTRDIVIQGNRFSGCHYGFNAVQGSITIDELSADRSATPVSGIAKNILITENVFESCPTAAIQCRSADNLVIMNNQIGPTWTKFDSSRPSKAIILSRLVNSKITGNTSTAPNTIVVTDSTETTVSGNKGFSA